jgi:hypothetical protein
MERFVVDMLNIGETLIPYVWMFGVLHAQDMNDNLIDDLYLAIDLGLEGSGFSELSVQ